MERLDDYGIVTTTLESIEDANSIAKTLVDQKLGACVQIIPIDSIYRWENKLINGKEYSLHIKTRRELYGRIEKLLVEIHPYDNPEIIMLPIFNGAEKYLNWINKETV